MDLYNGYSLEAQRHIQRTKDRSDTAFEANKKLLWAVKDIQTSIASQRHTCDSKLITQKTNFERLIADSQQYYYHDASKPVNNRNLRILDMIEASRTAPHPHNVFRSDFAIVDY